jgi:hypothetical protein
MPRRDRSKLGDAFGNLPDPVSSDDIDSAYFGEIAAVDKERRDAVPIDIFNIYPDITQPRRILPTEVRQTWTGDPADLPAIFEVWFQVITRERYDRLAHVDAAEQEDRSYFDLGAFLEGTYLGGASGEDEDVADNYVPGPLETSFRQIVDLAATIRRDGLINPITVAHAGANYRLETGERRWLAYHLLHAFYADQPQEQPQWQRIPAYTVDRASVWRMAHENNVRDDLNAIGRARQFALLMMSIYADQYDFQPFHDLVVPGGCDRVFYGQVMDGKQFPMPRGESEKLLNAMGFTSKSQLREHRQLLTLPDVVWQIADDLNWAQRRIRDLMRRAGGDEETLIKLAQQQAARERLSVGTPTLRSVPDNPKPSPTLPEDGPHRRGKILISRENRVKIRELMSLRSGVGQLDIQTRRYIHDEINAARRWLRQLEQALEVDE